MGYFLVPLDSGFRRTRIFKSFKKIPNFSFSYHIWNENDITCLFKVDHAQKILDVLISRYNKISWMKYPKEIPSCFFMDMKLSQVNRFLKTPSSNIINLCAQSTLKGQVILCPFQYFFSTLQISSFATSVKTGVLLMFTVLWSLWELWIWKIRTFGKIRVEIKTPQVYQLCIRDCLATLHSSGLPKFQVWFLPADIYSLFPLNGFLSQGDNSKPWSNYNFHLKSKDFMV